MAQNNQASSKPKIYYFDHGVFYLKNRFGYVAVPAPTGVALPKEIRQFILYIVEHKKILLFYGDSYDSIWL